MNTFATPDQTMAPPQPVQHMISYAGFWKRFVAHLIDQLVISAFAFIIIIPFLAMLGISVMAQDGNFDPSEGFLIALIGAYFFMIVFIVVAQWLYYAIMESTKGGTLGKLALSIRVTDMQGNPVSFGRATGRFFGKIISGAILTVGYIMAGFTQQKQALHDIIAGCLVINKY